MSAEPVQLGEYRLLEKLGQGGMAMVYRGERSGEAGFRKKVALKRMLPQYRRDPSLLERFAAEARTNARLDHPNLVAVVDFGIEPEPYLVMEFVEGVTLALLLQQLVEKRHALEIAAALFIGAEAAAGLDHAHRKRDEQGSPLGIVHRDVSPSNVLISFEGEVKLCDFGIAKALGGSVRAPDARDDDRDDDRDDGTESTGERSRVAGKAAYMSPEHARGEELDGRADVFAAGIVLWELCAGRRLYKGTEAEMLALAKRGEVPPLPDRGLPEQGELQAILDRALAPDPEARFPSAAEMLRALDDYAMKAKLFVSQIRFGSFLSDHFESDVVLLRRERERAAEALEAGPPVEIVALSSPEPTSPSGRPLAEETTKRLTASDAEPTSRAPMVLIGLAFAVVLVLLVVWAALR